VTCVRPAKGYFLDPRLVVEVLSPSTEKEDRTTKLDFYEPDYPVHASAVMTR
jgi:Uma2 family endonuclease